MSAAAAMRRIALAALAAAALAAAPAAHAAPGPDELRLTLARPTFAWGAQLGGSIDMSGQNMSSIDFNGTVGLRYKWIKLFGGGVGSHIMASNSCRSYLVFGTLRTDFLSSRRGLIFADLRGGAAINSYPGDVQRTGLYGFAGLGINLATGLKFASYITLGYSFVQRGDITTGAPEAPHTTHLPHLHCATAALGVCF